MAGAAAGVTGLAEGEREVGAGMLEAPAGFLVDELLELALGDLQPLAGVGMLGVPPLGVVSLCAGLREALGQLALAVVVAVWPAFGFWLGPVEVKLELAAGGTLGLMSSSSRPPGR